MRNVRAKYAGTCADSGCGRPYEVGHTIRRAWVCTHADHPAEPELAKPERLGPKPSPTVAEPEGQAVARSPTVAEQRPNGGILIVRPPRRLWGAAASQAAKAALKRCGIHCRTRMGRGTVAGKLSVYIAVWPNEPQPDPTNLNEVHGNHRPPGWWDWNEESKKWQLYCDLIASTAVGGEYRSDSDPGCDYQPLDDVAVYTDPDVAQFFDVVKWNAEGLYVPAYDQGTGKRTSVTWTEEDKPQWPVN